MNKQKQIEKLASLMADCNTTCDKCFEKLESVMTLPIQKRENYCQVYAHAQRAVEQGYRKLPKDSVVLTKEECEHKVILDEDHFERALNYEREKARKETAKEILLSLRRFLIEKFDYFGTLAKRNEEVNSDNRLFDLGEQDMANCTLDRVDEFLEKYGVEVEE